MVVYNGNVTVRPSEPTAVVAIAGRVIHVLHPHGTFSCGKRPLNNVEIVAPAERPWLPRCPKCFRYLRVES
jgi:hypothetical protein